MSQYVEVMLSAVWWEPSGYQRLQPDSFAIGPGVERIVLMTDGQGAMGRYDRIHVYLTNDKLGALRETEHLVFPAHFAQGWKVASK